MKRSKQARFCQENSLVLGCPYCANPQESAHPVTKEVLNKFQCPVENCPCKIVRLTSFCHPDAGQEACYCKIHGTLALFCGKCGELQSALAIGMEGTRKEEPINGKPY